MNTKYTNQYKTFESLMADIEDDLSSLAGENYIYQDKYLKVIQQCNSKLSVKINPIKEDMVTVEKGRAKLPNDFKVMETIYSCTSLTAVNTTLNFSKEIVTPPIYTLADIRKSCNNIAYFEDNKGMFSFVVYRKDMKQLFRIHQLVPVSIKNSKIFCGSNCQTSASSTINIQIVKEGDDYFIVSNYDGEYYFSYTSEMIDDDGNLLILDHPLVIPYYEYSVKERIFEDLWLNSLAEVQNKLSYVKENLRLSEMEAIRFVRMFDFAELKQVYFDNRKRFKLRYDNIIQE